MIADRDEPLRSFDDEGGLTHPVIGNLEVKNRSLLDLLGVAYLLQPMDQRPAESGWEEEGPDYHPHAYVLDEGVVALPSFRVYHGPTALPRAFVVHGAAPLPDRPQVLQALKDTDFRRTVLLEAPAEAVRAGTGGPARTATIYRYEPNKVDMVVDHGPAGYLVLADVWYPGWTCTVARQERPIYRANFLFRAVEVPAGKCRVVFTFAPGSYRMGRMISCGALALLLVLLVLGGIKMAWRRYGGPSPPPTPGAAAT